MTTDDNNNYPLKSLKFLLVKLIIVKGRGGGVDQLQDQYFLHLLTLYRKNGSWKENEVAGFVVFSY